MVVTRKKAGNIKGLLRGPQGIPSIMDGSRRLATVEFTDALDPAVHSFGILLRILKALYFHLLLETQTDPVSGLGLLGWLPTHFLPPLLTATLCCFEFSVSHKESTVGSDCLVDGSSSINKPRLSGFPSGRGTCKK